MAEPPTRHVTAALAAGIRAMQEVGELPISLDIDQAVAALLAGIQGGVTIMLSTGRARTSKPLWRRRGTPSAYSGGARQEVRD